MIVEVFSKKMFAAALDGQLIFSSQRHILKLVRKNYFK